MRGNLTGVQAASDASHLDRGEYTTFDIAGNVVKTVDANAHSTLYSFNDDGANQYAFPTKITNPLGHVSRAAYDYSVGQASWTMDINGTYTTTAMTV